MRADDAALRALQFEDVDVDTEDKGGILRMMRDESTAVPTAPPAIPEKGKESPLVVAEEPAAVELAPPPPATDETTLLKIFGIECDSTSDAEKMCTGVMNDVVGKMASTKTSNDMFLHEVSLRSIVLNQLFDNCDSVVDDVWAQCVERFHLPATKEGDRWLFDYGLSHSWTPDGPVVERTVLDAADALNALKTPSPVGSQDTAPRVVKRKPKSLTLQCIAMGRDGPCTKRVSKERASIGKVTCGYHDAQEPDDDNTDGEYEVIAPIQPNVALVSKANTVAELTQSIGRVARDKKRKTTVAVEPSQSKRMRWTDEEHQLFLEGIKQFGKGAEANRQISEKFVTTKTPSQVASHAQKYYLKANAPSAPLEDSAMNNVARQVTTTKSPIDLQHMVWVKTGKTAVWPGTIAEIHDGNGQCKTKDGFSPSEFKDGKKRFVVWTYDDKLIEPKTASNLTHFCPGTHFEKYKKSSKSPGFIKAVKTACEQFNKSRLDYDKSKNITTAPENLCTFTF
jgi:SHAQKYF class myb-like DNA-binding protein